MTQTEDRGGLGFTRLWNWLRTQMAYDPTVQNIGSCGGPFCKMYARLCSKGLCVTCCDAIHMVSPYMREDPEHKTSWITKPETDTTPALPAVYTPKPAFPEPQAMEETTEDPMGDWTLGKESTVTYYGY